MNLNNGPDEDGPAASTAGGRQASRQARRWRKEEGTEERTDDPGQAGERRSAAGTRPAALAAWDLDENEATPVGAATTPKAAPMAAKGAAVRPILRWDRRWKGKGSRARQGPER